MKTAIKVLASALFASLLTAFAPSLSLAGNDKTQTKAFAVAMFPAADASKLWVYLEKNYQSGSTINLILVNEQGQVLFDEMVCGKKSKPNAYRQKFDISLLADGNYTFRISAGTQQEEIRFKLSTPALEATQPTRLVAIK